MSALLRAALALTAVIALACQRDKGDQRFANTIIILTDTVRADHLGAHGYGRETSPFFDDFSRRNFWFENAYAPSSWTRPSVASLFTGTYPQNHGVQMRQDALGDTLPTLAELLRDHGAQTTMITTNPHVAPTWRLTRGFDRVVELMPDADQLKMGNDASVVHEQLRRLLPKIAEPFFLYVHLIDPHGPYLPPEEEILALGVTPPAHPPDLYDGELRFADRHIARMVRSLDDAELLDNTIVILTADHGEELLDHGAMGHGHTLYQEVVHIPLAMSVPARLLRRSTSCPRIRTNVSLVDIAPTVLSLLDLPLPTTDGRDVSDALRCEDVTESPLFFSVDKERASLAGILLDRTKLIVDRETGVQSLFVLDDNPGEIDSDHQADPTQRETATALAALLARFEGSAQPGVHLDLVGVEGKRHRQNIQVQLSTSGRIVTATPLGLEPTDRWGVSADRTSLWVDGWLVSAWHRAPKHMWAQDRDEWILEVDPPTAAITVSVRVDGRPADPRAMRQPSTESWPVTASRERLRRAPFVDGRAAGVYLYERRSNASVATADPVLREALRALGYQH